MFLIHSLMSAPEIYMVYLFCCQALSKIRTKLERHVESDVPE